MRVYVHQITSAGNRIWGKELDMQLIMVAWSPDDRRLLFCTASGQCHVIDANGNTIGQVTLHAKVCNLAW